MSWFGAIKTVRRYVVKIRTPAGHGTGFLVAYNKDGNLMAIATAAHVVSDADEWHLPLKIIPEESRQPVHIEHNNRVIWLNETRDSATMIVGALTVPLPKEPLSLVPQNVYMASGNALGWLGYPGIAPDHLCFFQGHTSAFVSDGDYYLIDGVAVNGVSGGPVFEDDAKVGPRLVGLVSAYYSNREVLPGLLKAYDLTHAHQIIQQMRSLDEAREAKQAQKEDATPKQDAPKPAQGPNT